MSMWCLWLSWQLQFHTVHYWQWERLYFMSNWISTRRIQQFYNFRRFHFCWKMHQFFSAMIKFNSIDRLKRYKIQLVSRNARLDFIIILHWIYCNTYYRWNINNITLSGKFGGKWTLSIGILLTAVFTLLTHVEIQLGTLNI